MPRGKKTLSGAPAGPATAPVGVPYGEGERAIESQRRMPVPNLASTGGPVPATGGTGGGGSAGEPAPADRFAQALAAAQQMQAPESMLDMPTQRPNETIQTGMLGSQNPAVPGAITNDALHELRALAQLTGYPEFLKLVAQAEREL